ncbi:hypothetical protein [Methylomonas methanica]|uniref:Uncharacterized protein n=1 Tax=Methylomonas methanica (strain DSM 25384 / MC09) TaxID=857087 RepID=F9ZZL2_METMM|nr:hypothetical protein [Methylomonas methanica]AEF98671.1 Protein of unknown function DUF2279, periplasmic lipoprotein [Methylomonas methanica MC09]
MKSISHYLILTGCLLLSLLMVMGLLAIDDTPHLNPRVNLTPTQIAKVKRLLERNDPRHLRTGSLARATLGQEELDLALNYAANQYAGGASHLIIEPGKLRVQATLPLPWHPPGGFLNFQIELIQTNTLPEIGAFSVGHLTVPTLIAHHLVNFSLGMLPLEIDWQQLGRMVKKVRFVSRKAIVTYAWQGNLPAQLGGALLSSRERELLWVYQARLAELTRGGKRTMRLTALLNALFQLAVQRGKLTDAVQENRAVLRVLAFYVTQKDLGQLMPSNKRWPRPIRRRILLQEREDFTKHYLVSALLAADAGSPLANAVGLYKEIQDSRGGSGFSFNDLAADRAGTQMGERAIAEHTAEATQQLLAVAAESDIMPETADLPEFMPEAEFKRRYGGLQGDAYRDMMGEIERRVAALTISR